MTTKKSQSKKTSKKEKQKEVYKWLFIGNYFKQNNSTKVAIKLSSIPDECIVESENDDGQTEQTVFGIVVKNAQTGKKAIVIPNPEHPDNQSSYYDDVDDDDDDDND